MTNEHVVQEVVPPRSSGGKEELGDPKRQRNISLSDGRFLLQFTTLISPNRTESGPLTSTTWVKLGSGRRCRIHHLLGPWRDNIPSAGIAVPPSNITSIQPKPGPSPGKLDGNPHPLWGVSLGHVKLSVPRVDHDSLDRIKRTKDSFRAHRNRSP